MRSVSPLQPTIIPRSEHSISRKWISPNALRVLYRLKETGHYAYLVGGGVRDLLLGRESKDFDIAADATPGEVKKFFRNCRLIGRRYRVLAPGQRFGDILRKDPAEYWSGLLSFSGTFDIAAGKVYILS
jgi:hypothetical protein